SASRSVDASYRLVATDVDVNMYTGGHRYILSTSCASMSERSCDLERCRNIVNVTVELSSFGQPKKEKLEPHLRPLREAITTTWSKYFLGHR
ncbi:hypothetical protein Taro_013983, partial [Colocasia esculenta]|nr:hypothetical protein [Colocasia esculenta]